MKHLIIILLAAASLPLLACQNTGQTLEVRDASPVTLSISGMT